MNGEYVILLLLWLLVAYIIEYFLDRIDKEKYAANDASHQRKLQFLNYLATGSVNFCSLSNVHVYVTNINVTSKELY